MHGSILVIIPKVWDLRVPISCPGSGNMKRRPAARDGAVLFKFERDSSPLDAVLYNGEQEAHSLTQSRF